MLKRTAKKKDKTFWGVLGVILLIGGITATIPLALKGEQYLIGIPITALAVITGILLIAWAFSN